MADTQGEGGRLHEASGKPARLRSEGVPGRCLQGGSPHCRDARPGVSTVGNERLCGSILGALGRKGLERLEDGGEQSLVRLLTCGLGPSTVVADHCGHPRRKRRRNAQEEGGENPDRLFGSLKGVLASAEIAEHVAQVVEAPREIGEKGVGSLPCELSSDLDGLVGGCESVLASAEIAEANAQIVRQPSIFTLLGFVQIGSPLAKKRKASFCRYVGYLSKGDRKLVSLLVAAFLDTKHHVDR